MGISTQLDSEELLSSGATLSTVIVGALALTFVAAVCATASRPQSKESIENDIEQGDRMNSAKSFGMESNELFRISQNAKAQLVAPTQDRNQSDTRADLDEDEMANAQMHTNLEHHRRLTMGKADMKRPTSSAQGSTAGVKFMADSGPQWLHTGVIKRDAIAMLREHERTGHDGSLFLVREKNASRGMYALDVLTHSGDASDAHVEHFLVCRAPTGLMEVDGVLLRSGARTLEAVIAELHGNNQFFRPPLAEYVPAKQKERTLQSEEAPIAKSNSRDDGVEI